MVFPIDVEPTGDGATPPDAGSCATGFDEDTDGVVDVCDFCPQFPSTANVDADGDGVGDTCDPHPGNTRDAWEHFDGFHVDALDPGWVVEAEAFSATGDRLTITPRPGARMYRDALAVPGSIAASMILPSTPPPGEVYVGLEVGYDPGARGSYLCAVHDGPVMQPSVGFRLWNSGVVTTPSTTVPVGRGAFFRLRAGVDEQGRIFCQLDGNHTTTPVVAGLAGVGTVGLFTQDGTAEVEWVAVVRW